MPTFLVTGPDGNKYRVNTPEGATQQDAIAYIANTQYKGGKSKGAIEDYLEEVPLVGGMLTGAADIGLGAVQGLAGVTGAAAEAFGAESSTANFFEDIAQGARDLMSAQERGDLEAGQRAMDAAKDKGIWEQVKAAASAFAKSPATLTAQALGSAAPFIAATVATEGAAAPIILGGMAGAGAVKGGIYDAVEQAAVEKGIAPEAAKAMADEAQSYLGENVDQIALGGVLGAIAGKYGLEPAAARVFGSALAEGAVSRAFLARTARGVATEAIPEAGQAGQEQFAQNLALQREGYDVPLSRGVAGQAALEGIMGGVPGGILGAFEGGPSDTRDEQFAADRAAFERTVGDEGTSGEERDKAIADYAARLDDAYGFGPDFSSEFARAEYERVEQERAAAKARAEARDAEAVPTDVGGTEPSVPDTGDGLGEPAAQPAEPDNAGMGADTGAPDTTATGAGVVEPPLTEPAPIIPPIEEVSPQASLVEQLAPTVEAQPVAAPEVAEAEPVAPILTPKMPLKERVTLAQQMVEQAVIDNPELSEIPNKIRNDTARRIAQNAAKGTLLDAYAELKPLLPEAPSVSASAITPEAYVDRYMAGEGRGETPADLELQQFAANFPKEIEAEFAKRQTPESAPPAAPTAVEEARTAQEVEEASELVAPPEKPAYELPEELRSLQAFVDENNPGFEVRYRPDNAKKYAYGLPGQKNLDYATTVTGLRRKILKEAPLNITGEVEGVPVRQMPAAAARGVKTEPEPLSRQAFGTEYEDPAGKLNEAQQEQIDLLMSEIDTARRGREIDDYERTQLVEMLRTPRERELMRDTTWRLADTYQKQIDALVKQGRKLRSEETILAKATKRDLGEAVKQSKKGKPLLPEEADLLERIKDNAKQTKEIGAKLLEQKRTVYDRVRTELETKKSKRKEDVAKIEKRREQAKRNAAKGYIDATAFRKVMRETTRDLRNLRPEPARYRKGRGETEGILLSTLDGTVQAITEKWKVPLKTKTVQSVSDLPSDMQDEMEAEDNLDAFGFLKGDTVYLIADNMDSVDDVAPTLFHEALGHLGLRRAFRNSLDDVLNDVYRTNKKVAEATDKWMAENPDAYASDPEPLARAVEEVLAEASEDGPITVGKLDKLVRFMREAIRRVFGIDLKISDGEVRTMLAMAHEQAIEGGGPAVGSSSLLFARKKAKKQEEAEAETLTSSAKTTKGMDKIQMSTDRIDESGWKKGVMDGLSEAINARNVKDFIKGLAPSRMRRQFIAGGGLNILPTDGMLDYAETLLGADNPAVREMREAVDAMDRLNASRSTMRRALARTVRDLKEFIFKHGNNVLGDTMYYGNYFNIDMTKFTKGMSDEDAFKTDGVWRRYAKLLKNTALDAKQRADYTAKQTKRQKEILEGIDVWNKLGELEGGQALYKRVRDMHKEMYNSRRYLIKQYIENLKDAGVSDAVVSQMMKAYQEQYERLNNVDTAPDADEAHKDYPEVPLGLFHREYFPKRRFGKYWLRMKKTKVGEPVLQFFTTMKERDAALASFAEDMGFDPSSASAKDYYALGDEATTDINEFDGVSTNLAFNRALNLIGNIDPQNFTEEAQKKLQADVYQLFLMGSPEGSVRKQFIKSKNRLGWSQDIVKIVGATAEEYATDISRLRYGQQVDQALRNARSASDDAPREEARLASNFINQLQKRIDGEMQPQVEGLANQIVPWMNQFAFLSFLTAPATALVQLTALPIRVAPNLWGKYGMAATTKAMGRYSNVFNNRPKREAAGTQSKSYRIATLRESNIVKNSKRHQEALRQATDELGLIKPLSEFTMHDERTPESAAQGKRMENFQKAYDAMTYLFDTTEQLSREVTFMAAYDLEYDKLAKEGVPEAERQKRAITAAKDTVNYTLGNYTNLNRPMFMKSSELAKALFLFKQYSVITTRFFFTSMRTMFGKNVPKETRVAVMKEATGVLGMSFLFGGVVGLPLYSVGMMALQALQDATDDDEDRRERMRQNPMTADSVEMQFRYEWLPKHFGPPTVVGKDGKDYSLSDIILNGPVSEISGWNFGSRVSLDVLGLWFRSPKEADTLVGTVNNALVENIPGVSASLNMVAMGEEFSKGNVADALKVGLPAFFRGAVKAYDLADEGLRTKSEKVRIRAEDIENSELIGTVLGFNPTKIAKVQQQTRDILGRTKDLQEEKSALLSNYTRAVRRIRNGDSDGYEAARKAADKIKEYNSKVGNEYLAISYTNLMNSLRGAVSEEKYDIDGMGLTAIENYYVDKTLSGK